MRRLNRRDFIAATSSVIAAPGFCSLLAADAGGKRKAVAFLGTEVRQHSHAQHFLDRLTEGYTWGGGWAKPRVDVASVFIDQHPDGDLSGHRIKKHGLREFKTIEDALTLGTGKLAVDGVVIIAEHGNYPTNEKGQRRYPRCDWFKKVVKVFEDSGKSVPVFNDKHLSTKWNECVEMVADSKRLGFEFLAGSSLPVTRRMPEIDMPYGAGLKESVCVAYGGVDSYDIHALETAQCMSERRKGGEVGIRSVHAARDENLWNLLEGTDRELTRRLIVSALTRSHNLPVEGGFPTAAVTYEWFKKTLPNTTGYLIEHLDGFHTTMLLTGIQDFNYAGYIADEDEIVSCQMYLPMPTHGSTTADFFNPLTRHIEDLVIDNKAPYPVERTLLTSGMVIAGVNSLHRGQVKVATPEMAVKYTAPTESTYWRG
ncbi:MAG: hypothetical protein KDB27_04375 [Planctomycetales bacterium]|nr:hypothetical protein [Planctomycetales bacterium]